YLFLDYLLDFHVPGQHPRNPLPASATGDYDAVKPSVSSDMITTHHTRGRGSTMPDRRFTVLYDGACPFCRLEARWLNHLNRSGHLELEDIAAPDFDPGRYGCTLAELMGVLHAAFPDGRMTRGVETFRQAYRAVGSGWLIAPTGWPMLRPVF